ncbi:hypothetical protein EPUS_00630 [Endocarpon pusillum Z07020]|uniref:Uncharacterized protein n=1 Tax=Endocarpon pusillum (strain Z07020 / HMAS-L-300199) TaxID=1263415 RepID=U1GIM3_ENDPU|nr:uncharacterized protein EPUS_00630 [Endocarpon pusillum Z07020]ERF71641.1 hypothetical protein EPUS_00630 [Endocarpon pusillum Z07020]
MPPPPYPSPGKPPQAPFPPRRVYPTPLLRLKIQDLSEKGARSFLSCIDAAGVLEEAVRTVLDLLYPGQYWESWPGSRSVTLVLSSFGGVAYTRGKALDHDHKEIHLSTDYVAGIKPDLLKREITGVIVHEMVHCWQWDGCGTAPGGLIEGLADWVRLRADLSPPHWKRTTGDRWDAGYQMTAWFLDWLEKEYGTGTVPRLNHLLKEVKYDEEEYWCGRSGLHKSVQELWKDYKRWVADEDKEEVGELEGKEGKDENETHYDESKGREERRRAVAAAREAIEKCKQEIANRSVSEMDEVVPITEGAETKLENGWTELNSSDVELGRRESGSEVTLAQRPKKEREQ